MIETFAAEKDLFDKHSGVLELTKKDFIIKNNELILKKPFSVNGLLIFYAPWCEHCVESAEKWSEIANQFKYRFTIAAINCENKLNEILRLKSNIEYYPTIKYITAADGKIHNLESKLTSKNDIMYFICNHLAPPIKT